MGLNAMQSGVSPAAALSPQTTPAATGGVSPKAIKIPVGDTEVSVPAPPKDLMPPQQGASLDDYEHIIAPLYDHFLRAMDGKTEGVTMAQQEQALGNWLTSLGWSD